MTKADLMVLLKDVSDEAEILVWHNEAWKPAAAQFGFLKQDSGELQPSIFVEGDE